MNHTAMSGLGGLFFNDALMPAQFAAMHATQAMPPEKALMLAVLECAIDDLVRYVRYDIPESVPLVGVEQQGRRIFAEARDWLASTVRDWPAAFESVCDHLGFDPGYIRRGVAAQLVAARAGTTLKRAVPSERAWAWALDQTEAWTSARMAREVGVSAETARGFVNRWMIDGLAVVAGVERLRGSVQTYLVRQKAVATT